MDTLHAGGYILTFENTDSFPETDIYGDLGYRKKLTDTLSNSHNRAQRIQEYLKKEFGDMFFTTDSFVVLRLSTGQTVPLPLWDSERDEGFTFEHYFNNIDYYLLRVQWGEGNCWMLVNRKNGFKKYISGRPYISKNKKSIVTINTDLEAGYSFNGIEYYSVNTDSLTLEFSKQTEWGPADIQWLDDHSFLMRRAHFHVDTVSHQQDNIVDYKTVTIEKKIL